MSRLNDNVVVRCTPDLRVALEQLAGPRGMSRTVRDALTEYVRQKSDQRPDQRTAMQERRQ